jgi:hypothetical protein
MIVYYHHAVFFKKMRVPESLQPFKSYQDIRLPRFNYRFRNAFAVTNESNDGTAPLRHAVHFRKFDVKTAPQREAAQYAARKQRSLSAYSHYHYIFRFHVSPCDGFNRVEPAKPPTEPAACTRRRVNTNIFSRKQRQRRATGLCARAAFFAFIGYFPAAIGKCQTFQKNARRFCNNDRKLIAGRFRPEQFFQIFQVEGADFMHAFYAHRSAESGDIDGRRRLAS